MPNATTDDSWRASGRPVSTIARSFSAALDEAFFMKPDLDNLSQSVAQKYAVPWPPIPSNFQPRLPSTTPPHSKQHQRNQVLTPNILPENRQQSVSTQKSELEELEARLRETEARLKTQQASDSSSTSPAQTRNRDERKDNNINSPRSRNGVDRAFDPPGPQRNAKSPLPPTRQENISPQAQASKNGGKDPRAKNF
ncbi:hypothetical protein EPUS_01601 [Endocarpon pusillum Z07020]|uniref:Uncharacterized protein n=1 Tax=Endocarpon pusillum (strain Z07020 / HMAS-L-300199) TaxID=1263415 RepID=U1GUQ2_ENDPU|nr:uncharacterized protein EPUS_01601 [Endocarpon pusillum Z07020]ERF75771.1 hypothetical protein EPUS_01601 [Endocarpon pusillum Z07020]